MLRIANIGLNAKYSLIDWRKHFSNLQKTLRYDFLVQQFLISYQFTPAALGKRLVKFYAAGLSNLIASNLVLPQTYAIDSPNLNFGKQNWGGYVGVSIGQVRKKGDWAVETNWQIVQAQTVPSDDFAGIGRGNIAGAGLYTINNDGSGSPTIVSNATGPCNYYGFEIDALYAFTNNLTIEENFRWSNTLNTGIGPNLKLRQFEVEFIYAF